ncbi:MAG TPA: hypothetical protein PKJ26_00185 [Candidatus Woesebacteria bacterium]|jgi:hypothetical protein|nr:hypothetical protein [Candidatus Woesebacteria bacterium]HNS64894.1 hypothetical protein [Candidatus Woesebacteria bacterium]
MPNIPQLKFQMVTTFSIILGVLLLFGLATNLLTPRYISCRIDSQAECPKEVLADLLFIMDSQLLFSDIQKQIVELNSIKGRYEIVKVSKDLWGDIIIDLKPLSTAYSLITNNAAYAVTSDGALLQSTDSPELITDQTCTLTFSQDTAVEKFFPEQTSLISENQINHDLHSQMLTILNSLQSRQLQCLKIQPVDQQTWVIWLPTVDQIVVNPTEIDSNLNRLSFLLDTTLLTEQRPANSFLDLRFALPVLRNSL